MQNLRFKIQNLLLIFCIFNFAFLINCSIPNLEAPECTAARGTVKEFYSYHFGDAMRFSPVKLKKLEPFMTPEFARSLQNTETDNDILTTNSTDYPKAFRIGKCQIIEPNKTNVEVLLFWKNDERTEQRTIAVEAVKENDKWLVNRINR